MVSEIAEYTEEEEMEGRRAWKSGPGGSTAVVRPPPPESQLSDDVYDDVGATETQGYDEDDEVYEVLD